MGDYYAMSNTKIKQLFIVGLVEIIHQSYFLYCNKYISAFSHDIFW